VWHAGDLLSSAFVVGAANQFEEAAEFIKANRASAPAALLDLAEKIAPPAQRQAVAHSPASNVGSSVRRIRARLREEPRNAIQWVELSRLYTALGKRARALDSMRVAVALAPDSRFVVRSAARLFSHEHDSVAALRTIRSASGAKSDPWLLAAEIAVSSASGAPSLLARAGRLRNDDASLSEFERTELSSALGTLELENGRKRHARQLFRRALASPNENSVAQVEWANREIGGLEVENGLPSVPCLHEARAQFALASGDWGLAIASGRDWLEDQFFSKSPAVFTSYVSSLIENYDASIEILRNSLRLNPGDSMLLNNLAFALASNNQVSDAIEVLRKADYAKEGGASGVTLPATHGLVCFRTNQAERGRALYRLAMDRAAALGAQKYKIMAELYLAREELLAMTAVAPVTAREALARAAKSPDKEVAVLAGQVRKLYDGMERMSGAASPSSAI
jgi:tetratricopeptide (TPR) repeat protein